jgi:bacillithiol synthase
MRTVAVSGVRLNPSPAVEAFLFAPEKVAAAFEYDWTRQESFAARAAWLNDGGFQGDRKAVAAALKQYNQALGADAAAMGSIALLAQEGTLTVVTGQQPGILAGPAYSVYKAMTAIRLAKQQSERLGVPVVPVFWVAGEDHDWHEVSWVMTPHGDTTERLHLKENFDHDRRSVGMAPAPASTQAVLEEFIALLPDTEFKPAVMDQIRAALEAPPALTPALTDGKPSLADWFARLMTWIFAGTGLVMINPVDPALRKVQAGFFQQVIRRNEAVEAAFTAGIERWQAMGYQPTVEHHLGNLNLFTYAGGDRLPLVGAGEHFWVRDREEMGWSREDLLDRAATHPELFSTNVVLRPVGQGVLLPDLAIIGGPGEISYFGLFKEVYRALDGQMPVIYPRESFTLVEPPLARILEKQELSLEDIFFNLECRKNELLEREDRLGINQIFEAFRDDFGARYEMLVETVLQLDPTLKYVTEENRKQIAVQINKLEEKAKQQHRKNCEVATRQYDRLKAQLTPHGLQERAVTILPYLAKYGPDLVARLLVEVEFGGDWVHRAVYLG